jgi:hypothetical protein
MLCCWPCFERERDDREKVNDRGERERDDREKGKEMIGRK